MESTKARPSMNRYLLAAALLSGLAAVVHGVGAELIGIRELRASEVPLNTQVELRAVWHGYTVILAGSAWLLLQSARGNQRIPLDVLAIFYGSNGVIWIIVVLLMGKQNFINTPQWSLLLVISGLIAMGRRTPKSYKLAN